MHASLRPQCQLKPSNLVTKIAHHTSSDDHTPKLTANGGERPAAAAQAGSWAPQIGAAPCLDRLTTRRHLVPGVESGSAFEAPNALDRRPEHSIVNFAIPLQIYRSGAADAAGDKRLAPRLATSMARHLGTCAVISALKRRPWFGTLRCRSSCMMTKF